MKKVLIVLASLSLVVGSAFAQSPHHGNELNPAAGGNQQGDNQGNNDDGASNRAAAAAGSGQLRNHGGPVMNGGKVVCIFWGSIPSSYTSNMQAFRSNSNGMVSHMGMLTQYGVTESTLVGSHADVFDPTPPSAARVTDVMVQQEVARVVGFTPADLNTVYEVFIPSGYYSDDGTGATSCGGPNLQYCAYHSSGDGSHLNANAKYSIEPWPGCSGCSASGWTTNQNANHFMVHETRESLTDPFGTAWWDAAGYEADDKCAWQGLFISNGYGYQPEYSNSARNCVQ
ncbi:MAG TPA: hypothetical protein VGQ21_11195 [Thermoanaerobaculia bacterium]|jgi:hypothetical protein|nr:hypothetical protein [Thermoanaerobaculia bacterium]